MSKGSYISPVHRRYRLEPGNGMRYEFSITWLAVPREDLVKVVSGVSEQPYVTITVHNCSYPGTYEFMIESLEKLEPHVFHYAYTKMPHISRDDVRMILRACSVLVKYPMRIEKACERMMEE